MPFFREYLYDSLNWQHYAYSSSWSVIARWKEDKSIDNYRCYEEEIISRFVLKNQLDEPSPKHDTVAAVLSLIFYCLFIFGFFLFMPEDLPPKFPAKLIS